MALRISLIIAIVASAATLVLSHLKVAERIQTLETTLAQTQQELAVAQQNEAKARQEAQQLKDQLDQTTQELDQTKAQLAQVQQEARQQRARADRVEEQLHQTRVELAQVRRRLAAWEALQIPIEEIRSRLAALEKAKATIAALQEENRILLRKATEYRNRLMVYEGEELPKVELPKGLKGHVVATDPKWDFVILDIGGEQGVLPGGELLVSRDGKLVAKVRVVRVEKDQSVANVLPEWKQAEVKPGDLVIAD